MIVAMLVLASAVITLSAHHERDTGVTVASWLPRAELHGVWRPTVLRRKS